MARKMPMTSHSPSSTTRPMQTQPQIPIPDPPLSAFSVFSGLGGLALPLPAVDAAAAALGLLQARLDEVQAGVQAPVELLLLERLVERHRQLLTVRAGERAPVDRLAAHVDPDVGRLAPGDEDQDAADGLRTGQVLAPLAE